MKRPQECIALIDGDFVSIWVPEVRHRTIPAGATVHAMRGHGYVLAVVDAERKCIGWIDSQDIGFDTSRDWLAAQMK